MKDKHASPTKTKPRGKVVKDERGPSSKENTRGRRESVASPKIKRGPPNGKKPCHSAPPQRSNDEESSDDNVYLPLIILFAVLIYITVIGAPTDRQTKTQRVFGV